MTRLHPDDITAIAERVAALLGAVVPAPAPEPLDTIAAIQRRSLELARQGKRAESIALQRTITKVARRASV